MGTDLKENTSQLNLILKLETSGATRTTTHILHNRRITSLYLTEGKKACPHLTTTYPYEYLIKKRIFVLIFYLEMNVWRASMHGFMILTSKRNQSSCSIP